MKVLKFGGSSIGSSGRILNVKSIIEKSQEEKVIVVSAFNGVTDLLEQMCIQASVHDVTYMQTYNTIERIHTDIIIDLFKSKKLESINQHLHELLHELQQLIKSVYLLGDVTPKIKDRILSFGERMSSHIIFSVIDRAALLNVTDIIQTNSNYGNAQVNFSVTNNNIQNTFEQNWSKNYIVPGFIAANAEGEIATLGRGGSDYTAAIFASALNAECIEIWTDVDGFMTADPMMVKKAFAIEHLTYAEAMELSHFGAKVVYSPTIQPVFSKNIEVHIKNSYNPELPGTVINNLPGTNKELIKGISSINDIHLLTLQGPGMVGVKGISSRLFGALAAARVNIILITQASSEYSISFAISPSDSEIAVQAINKEFDAEIVHKNEINVIIEKELSVIAIVGEQMRNKPGISAILFSALGRNGISVIATAQGSSELNISVVIKKESLKKALNVIHEGFFLSHIKELHLFIVGIGTVGSNLIQQIATQQEKLLNEHHLKVNIIGVSNSRKMLVDEEGIDPNNYVGLLQKKGVQANIKEYAKIIETLNMRNSVFVDCTASDKISEVYDIILESFVSVVTANKVACSSDYAIYQKLKAIAKQNDVKFFFETNVGAGLPIISTLNALMNSGDKILKIEAVLSGTLNFIFNELSAAKPLSAVIKEAKEMGFSEPDPRLDLSGGDVLRKIIILAREAGYKVEQTDVEQNPLLPDECFEGSVDDFWEKVKAYDSEFEEKRKQLVANNKKWRFMAEFDNGKMSIGLKEVSADHPSYFLEGSNNIILLTTERYKEHPMVVKGYGAGAEVTAAGVFADIIRVANV